MKSVSTSFTTLGMATTNYRTFPVAQSLADRLQHLFIIGQTGTGKSTLIRNLVTQDITAGRGTLLIDPHGDLALALRGVRNTRGGRLTLCGLGNILQNPFYIGLIYIKSTGKTYEGVHEPIIPVETWQRVQDIRQERSGPKSTRHNHLFQGLFRCGLCNRPMVPERQKGHVYYRCKGKECPTKTIREDALQTAILNELRQLELSAQAKAAAAEPIDTASLASVDEQRTALALQIADEERHLDRLTDLLVDDAISVETHNHKRHRLQISIAKLKEQIAKLPDHAAQKAHQDKLAELRNSLVLLYDIANRAEKRMIIENVWPNRTVTIRKPTFKPYSWVTRVETGVTLLGGAQERDRGRTLIDLFEKFRTKQLDETQG